MIGLNDPPLVAGPHESTPLFPPHGVPCVANLLTATVLVVNCWAKTSVCRQAEHKSPINTIFN